MKAETFGVEASQARRRSAEPWFPANPVLSASLASRRSDTESATNWSLSLGQEIEIAGQRGGRLEGAGARAEAQQQRLVLARRAVAAEAWATYFERVAAEEEVKLARRIEATLSEVDRSSSAMAERGVLSGLEAAAVTATAREATSSRLEAERRLGAADASLAALLGRPREARLEVAGDLDPLPSAAELARHASARLDGRPELRALDAEARAFAADASTLRRSRIPNLTISGTVQNDGFQERVLGLGVAIPIPLPEPLGRFHEGAILEARALEQRARAERDGERRILERDVAIAVRTYEIRVAQKDNLPEATTAEAERLLARASVEVQAGRLAVRDILVLQQSLLTLLRERVAVRLQLALASIDVLAACGAALEEGIQ